VKRYIQIRISVLAVVLVVGCGGETEIASALNTPDAVSINTDSGSSNDSDGADGSGDVAAPTDAEGTTDSSDTGEPDTITPDTLNEDVVDIPEDDTGPVTPPPEAQTQILRLSAAIYEDTLVTADRAALRTEKFGLPAKIVTTWAIGSTPTSPLVLESGLRCWDINGNGTFEQNIEDFDDNGEPSEADCQFHPPNTPDGWPGAAVAVNILNGEDETCAVSAFTLTGLNAWTVPVPGRCQRLARIGDTLVAVSAAGLVGEARLINARTGAVKATIELPALPTTAPVRVGNLGFVVGTESGLVRVAVGFGLSGMWVAETKDVSPDRPTWIVPLGPSQIAVAYWRNGDLPQSLGARIQRYSASDLDEIGSLIDTPGDLWAAPVAAVVDGSLKMVLGGAGWLYGFEVESETPWLELNTDLGTVTGLALAGDGLIYVTELEWLGVPEVAGPGRVQVWPYDPVLEQVLVPAVDSTLDLPVRWAGSAALVCDVLILQAIPDGLVLSERLASKPCGGGLVANGYARDAGDNLNSGTLSAALDCTPGPGVPPCKGEGGCESNSDCDDENFCTIDSCVAGVCSYKFIAGCCIGDTNCDDFDPCTLNSCVDNQCQFIFTDTCCESASECDDDAPCTVDICDQGTCLNLADSSLPGCCDSNTQCNDGVLCTVDICGEDGECSNEWDQDCCIDDFSCLDGAECTLDLCINNQCVYVPTPAEAGCCSSDAECVAPDACQIAACDQEKATCEYGQLEDCCLVDADCDDESNCTTNTCENNVCASSPNPGGEGCCNTIDDCSPGEECAELTACEEYTCIYDIIGCCTDEDCDDEIQCTVDVCVELECQNTLDFTLPNCCETAADCDDGNLCTNEVCDASNQCFNNAIPNCCFVPLDCLDTEPNTAEDCVDNVCQYEWCLNDIFEEATAPVDIVFVVDQSVSMTDEIPAVRNYLNDFAGWIGTAGLDYHVILVATRFQGANQICIDPPLAGPGCSDSEVFMQVDVQVGSNDPLQKIIDNIDEIESFMRMGSVRQIVVITDDDSNLPSADFSFFLASRPDWDDWTLHGLVSPDAGACSAASGEVYLTLASETGGVISDICGTEWTDSYSAVGQTVSTATTSFVLPYEAESGSLSVKVGGQTQQAGTDWIYDDPTKRVTLVGVLPPSGTPVEICFEPMDYEPMLVSPGPPTPQ
jgi:hypothetical protein